MNWQIIGNFRFRNTVQVLLRRAALIAAMFMCLALFAPWAMAQGPCCQITAINQQTGIVTAKVNATGQVFEFKVTNPALLQSLKVGEAIYANFTTRQVSVDGKTPCGTIVSLGPAKGPPPPPAPSKAPSPPPGPQPGTSPGPTVGSTSQAGEVALAARANPACCGITSIDARARLAAAKVNSTGQGLEFSVPNSMPIQSLHAGQPIWANFKARKVSLDGQTACCDIVRLGAAPPSQGVGLSPPPATQAAAAAVPAGSKLEAGIPSMNKPNLNVVWLSSVSLSQNSVIGGTSVSGTVTLSGKPTTPIQIVLASSNAAATVVPTQISMPAGETTSTFQVNTVPLAVDPGAPTRGVPVTISAALATGYGATQRAGLFIRAPVRLSPSAPAAGKPKPEGASVPSAEVPSGKVSSAVSASRGSGRNPLTTPLTTPLAPIFIESVTLSPSSVIGGTPASGTVNMSGPVPETVNITLSASSSSTESATISPAQVTLIAGDTTAPFSVTTTPVMGDSHGQYPAGGTVVQISATPPPNYGGPQKAQLQVEPPSITNFYVWSPQVGGTKTFFFVQLSGAAGKPYYRLNMATDRPDLVPFIDPRWRIPEGQDWMINPYIYTKSVAAPTQAKFSVSQAGKTLESTLLLNPPGLGALICRPLEITGGASGQCETGMDAPLVPGASAKVVLSSNKPDVLTVPLYVIVNATDNKASFPFNTKAAGAAGQAGTFAGISASYAEETFNAPIKVFQLPLLQSLTLNPNSVTGGHDSIATVQVNTQALGSGVDVQLTSDNPQVVSTTTVTASLGGVNQTATLPIHISPGNVSGDAAISTQAAASVNACTDIHYGCAITATASLGGVNQTAKLYVYPPAALQKVYFSPDSIAGLSASGGKATLVVELSSAPSSEPSSFNDPWTPWYFPLDVYGPNGLALTGIGAISASGSGTVNVPVEQCRSSSCSYVATVTYAGVTKSATLTVYP